MGRKDWGVRDPEVGRVVADQERERTRRDQELEIAAGQEEARHFLLVVEAPVDQGLVAVIMAKEDHEAEIEIAII